MESKTAVSKKRERCKNFLEDEKEHLIELVASYKHIIENKKTDSVMSKQKDKAWASITEKFNATSKTGIRSAQQLKLLYGNLKKTAKKKKADEKVETYKTGGGSKNADIVLNTCDNMLLELLGPTIEPRNNPYDSNESEDLEEQNNKHVSNANHGKYIIEESSDEESVIPPASAIPPTSAISPTSAIPAISSTPLGSSSVKEKISNFLTNVKSNNRKMKQSDVKEVLLSLKKERHRKKMEILEIIKKKELLDLKLKEMEMIRKENENKC